MKLALADVVAATGGSLLEPSRAPAEVIVSTDTRSLGNGDTFLALRGPSFDGHDFIAQAIARGASMVVVDRAESAPCGTAALVVRDGGDAPPLGVRRRLVPRCLFLWIVHGLCTACRRSVAIPRRSD